MSKVIIEVAHPSEYILDVFKQAIDNKIKTINFAEDELEYICEQIKGYHDGYAKGRADERKKCTAHEDGCEEWAGCPCIYYKPKNSNK